MLTTPGPAGVLGILAAVGALVLAGCGGGGEAGAGEGGGTRVTVEETEFAIALSESRLGPGTYTFVVRNAGSASHALEVEGPGVEDAATATIAPGETAELTVTFGDGTYELYCPVAGHRAAGMAVQVGLAGGTGTTGKSSGGYGGY